MCLKSGIFAYKLGQKVWYEHKNSWIPKFMKIETSNKLCAVYLTDHLSIGK